MTSPTKQWKLLKSERGPDLPLFKVRYDYQQNLRNNVVLKAVVLESADSVNVVAMTPEQKILLVRQFRFGTQKMTIELPGGLVDPGEDSKTAIQRELREETGYTASHWQYLGAIGANPVFIDSEIHHFLATNVQLTEEVSLDEGEQISLIERSISEVQQMVKSGEIHHPHTLSALARVIPLWEPVFPNQP